MTDWPFDDAFFRRLERLQLVSRRRFAGWALGERRGRRKGASLEFLDYRPYVAGDDLRYVDWNIYSRLDRLMVKRFVEERDLCLHLLIDTSASMGEGAAQKLAYALRAAAAFAYIALCSHERVAVGLFNDQLYQVSLPRRGRRQIFPLLELLRQVRAGGHTDLDETLTSYAAHSPTPGIAILISDLLDAETGYEEGIKSLFDRGFGVCVLHLLADEEIRPGFEGDVRLVDWEDARDKELSVGLRTRAQYEENFQRFCSHAEQFCRRYGVSYLRLTSTTPLEDLIFRQLRKSRFLR